MIYTITNQRSPLKAMNDYSPKKIKNKINVVESLKKYDHEPSQVKVIR